MKQAKHNIIQNSYHVRLFLLFQKNICTTIPLKGKMEHGILMFGVDPYS